MNRFQFWFILFFKLFNKRFMQIPGSLRIAHILLSDSGFCWRDPFDARWSDWKGSYTLHLQNPTDDFSTGFSESGWSCVLSWLLALRDGPIAHITGFLLLREPGKSSGSCWKLPWDRVLQRGAFLHATAFWKVIWNTCRLTKMFVKSDLTIPWHLCNSLNVFLVSTDLKSP